MKILPYPNGIADLPSAKADGSLLSFESLFTPGTVRLYTPARIETPHKFHVLTENVIEGIKQAKQDAEEKTYNRLFIVLAEGWGVRASLLKEIAECTTDALLSFEMDVRHKNLLLFGGTTRTTLYLREQKNDDVPLIFDFQYKPEAPAENKWVNKAIRKDASYRPELSVGWGQWASDGYRIHHDTSLPLLTERNTRELGEIKLSEDLREQVQGFMKKGRKLPNKAVVPVKPFVKMVKNVKSANGETIVLTFSKFLSANSYNENGSGTKSESRMTDGYKYTGKSNTVNVNPKFILDALSGMKSDKVTIRTSELFIYITDDERSAFMMAKWILYDDLIINA